MAADDLVGNRQGSLQLYFRLAGAVCAAQRHQGGGGTSPRGTAAEQRTPRSRAKRGGGAKPPEPSHINKCSCSIGSVALYA